MSKKSTPHYADAKGALEELPAHGITRAAGITVPADATAGYAPGCTFQHLDGSAGDVFYINEGTATSCDFNVAPSGAELAVLDGVTAGTAAASKAVVLSSEGEIVWAAQTTPAAVATTPGTAAGVGFDFTGGVGGGTTIATTGTGGTGGNFKIVGGAGGSATAAATAATGGQGGGFDFTGGAGGAEAVAGVTATGGAGGHFFIVTGAGGAVSEAVSGTATGGASGVVWLFSGTGGAVTATTGTNVGGASGGVRMESGTGGAASGATDTGGASGTVQIVSGTGGAGDTGGASGAVTVGSGTGGAGSGTGGASGNLTLRTGAAGSGGSPAVGSILLSPGATEKWRINSVGGLLSNGATPSNAATTDGAILATGGISFTDVANAWIDDETHGTDTVQHFIGTNTIDVTAPSDRRLKRDIRPTHVHATPLLLKLECVDFRWKDEHADPGVQFGFIAQQVHEAIPAVAGPQEGAGGLFYVKKHELVPYLVKAIQELHARIEVLEGKHGGL